MFVDATVFRGLLKNVENHSLTVVARKSDATPREGCLEVLNGIFDCGCHFAGAGCVLGLRSLAPGAFLTGGYRDS